MTRTVVIHQPDFIPHLAFFHRFARADMWMVLDHVTCSKRGWVHRDRIKTGTGATWLTVPLTHDTRDLPIFQIKIDTCQNKWRAKHLRLIEENYRKAAFFDLIFPQLKAIYAQDNVANLLTWNLELISYISDLLRIKIQRAFSRDFAVSENKSRMNVALLKAVGATRYLSGVGAVAYHDPAPFDEARITVEWQDFEMPRYPQQHGEFMPGLSVLDVLFNCGPENAIEMIRSSGRV